MSLLVPLLLLLLLLLLVLLLLLLLLILLLLTTTTNTTTLSLPIHTLLIVGLLASTRSGTCDLRHRGLRPALTMCLLTFWQLSLAHKYQTAKRAMTQSTLEL